MAPKRIKKEIPKRKFGNPFKLGGKDPSLPPTIPTTSKGATQATRKEADEESGGKKCMKFLYNKENKTFLGRTCKSWLYMVTYSIVYFMFLCTYTMIFLFSTLTILKHTKDYTADKADFMTYSEHGIGLTATPTSESSYPLIWYKVNDDNDYKKYVSAIDRLLVSRRATGFDYSDLGPCSTVPYGYGKSPCVIIRINRQWNWSGKPLGPNSTVAANAPKAVKEWLRSSRKLWLHCDGYHTYDKEHIGKIQYFPYPPGFDPNLFPLDVRNKTPLVAIQISDFTQGVSVAVMCNLWYEDGPSTIEFMLYVEPAT